MEYYHRKRDGECVFYKKTNADEVMAFIRDWTLVFTSPDGTLNVVHKTDKMETSIPQDRWILDANPLTLYTQAEFNQLFQKTP